MTSAPSVPERPADGARRIKASDWERYGEGLSLKQEEALAAVRHALAADDDVPSVPSTTALTTFPPAVTGAEARPKSTADPSELHTKTEFYQWFSDMEATRASEVEAKYKRHAEEVERRIDVCNEICNEISSVLEIFSELKLSQRAISGRTDALKEQCDRLVSEREKLTAISGSIQERLVHFDIEKLSSLFHAPVSASSDPQKILRGLEDLDSSLAFTSKHPEYLESSKYHARFQSLQKRAMSLVKSYFQESVAIAIAECKAAVASGAPGQLDATIMNVKFRAVAEPRLKELMAGVCGHAERENYRQLLMECSTVYCKARFELVRYDMLAAMQKITTTDGDEKVDGVDAANSAVNAPSAPTSHPVTEILTRTSEIVSRTAEAEIQLYRHLFQGTSHVQATAMLATLFDSMCVLLVAMMEPIIYSNLAGDVNGLCRVNAQLVDLIRHETLADVFDVPSLNKLTLGVEQMIIRQAKSDWKRGLADVMAAISNPSTSAEYTTLLEQSDAIVLRSMRAPLDIEACRARSPQPFEPVTRGVRMMTAVQASVSGHNAMDLIRDIVDGCLDTIHRVTEPETCERASELSGLSSGASVEQPDATPSEKNNRHSAEVYGAIFSLRQLFLLSQCLDSLCVSELDMKTDSKDGGEKGFGTKRENGGVVSSLSSRIPLLASLSSLTSRSSQQPRLSGAGLKAMMDKKMAVARDFCILTCAQDATNPLLSFLTKVTAAKVSGREQIKSNAFATLGRVKQLSADVRGAIEGPLVKNVALLHMVMPEPELTAVLEAIQANLRDAQAQMQDILGAEYAEDLEDIAFISFAETSRILAFQ